MTKRILLLVGVAITASCGGGQGSGLQMSRPALAGIYESVCHLRVHRNRWLRDGNFTSSAALYRERYLITAAHNVASTRLSRVTRIDVSCGSDAATLDHIDTSANAADVWVPRDYSMSRRYPMRHCTDYAVVRLRDPVPTGSAFRLGEFDSGSAAAVTVAGYPGGGRGGHPEMNSYRLFSASAPARAENGYLINYDVLTRTGVSGGPVWVDRGGEASLVAVHVGGTNLTARGRTITRTVREQIDAVIDAWEAGVATAALPQVSSASIGCG